MSEQLRYSIDAELKNEYNKHIIEKYGNKYSKCGSEITKAMKFQLAINGNEKYQDDPDVIAMLEKANEKMNPNKSKTINTVEERLEKMLEEKLEEKFAQFEKKTRRESSKKHGLAEFKKQFQMAFNNYHQVSKREVESFIMNQSDIVDKRSIQSRIQYLESHGILESFAPNVYNIVF